jgi:hypothetical protein
MTRARDGRRALFTAILTVGSVLAALAGLELGLRLAPGVIPLPIVAELPAHFRATLTRDLPVTTRDQMRALPRDDGGPELLVYRPSAEIRQYAPDPGMVGRVRLDSEGFCDPLPDEEGPASLVAVGDSFTFCTTVRPEDTWPANLGRRFGVATEDLGVPRLGLFEYLEVLKQVGLPKMPAVVVMNAYEGNDLRDAVLYWEARQAASAPPRRALAFGEWLRSTRVVHRSRAASFLVGAWLAWQRPSDASELARREGRRSRDVNFRYHVEHAGGSIAFNPENADRNEVVYADLLARGLASLDVLGPALETYAALAHQHGFTPVLAYTPSAYTAYGGAVRFDDPALAPLLRAYSAAQRAYFAARAAALGLRFVDLTEPLQRAAADPDLLYFPTNLHLTPAGHRAIASALGDALAADGTFASAGAAPGRRSIGHPS